jgi:hypothetical protein
MSDRELGMADRQNRRGGYREELFSAPLKTGYDDKRRIVEIKRDILLYI